MKNNIFDISKIFIKTILTSIFIGYIIFNLIYLINPCVPEYHHEILNQDCEMYITDINEEESFFVFMINGVFKIVYDQLMVIPSYLHWIWNAIQLDFGNNDGLSILNTAFGVLLSSLYIIFLSILIGMLLSFIIYKLSLFSFIDNYILRIILSFSFLHSIVFILFFKKQILYAERIFSTDLLVASIISFSSGMLYDYYSLLKTEHNLILNKDYVMFARHSGFNEYVFASKELIISFIYITVSRIPLLFASMVVLEIASNLRYKLMGYVIWKNIYQTPNYSIFFGCVFLTILFFVFLYFLADYLKLILSPKQDNG